MYISSAVLVFLSQNVVVNFCQRLILDNETSYAEMIIDHLFDFRCFQVSLKTEMKVKIEGGVVACVNFKIYGNLSKAH